MLNLDIHCRFHASKLLFLDQTLLYLYKYGGSKHVSMGAEKWLDTEIWNSPAECFSLDLKNTRLHSLLHNHVCSFLSHFLQKAQVTNSSPFSKIIRLPVVGSKLAASRSWCPLLCCLASASIPLLWTSEGSESPRCL